MYLTLQEWNARQRRPRSLETVRRWVRECRIFPPPVKDGSEGIRITDIDTSGIFDSDDMTIKAA